MSQSFSQNSMSTRSAAPLWMLLLGFVAVSYFIVLEVTGGASTSVAALSVIANVAPLAMLGLAVRALVRGLLAGRAISVQVACHLVAGPVFACIWYWILMVLIGVTVAHSPVRFEVRSYFPNAAIAWQLLQGLTFYGLIAALASLEANARSREAPAGRPPALAPAKDRTPLKRYFLKLDDEILPIEVDEIISISGAGDYTEVATNGGRHLTRMTLAEFEEVLDGASFVRVHRSKIVNVGRILRAEPSGGGRLLIHMQNGELVQASRSGSRALRERVV